MEIILEYTYTGSIKQESLTENNIIETFFAADYFQLSGLQDFIMKTFKNFLRNNNIENLPELLSKVAETMPLMEDNNFLNLLIESVATIPLNTIEFGRLSIAGLQYLLYYTYEKEKPFVTPEYEVFRYSAILAAKQVSNDAFKSLIKKLPALEQLKQIVQVKNKFIIDHQKVAKELEPLFNEADYVWDQSALCASENFDYEIFAGYQPTGWVLSSNGYCWNSNKSLADYCPRFGDQVSGWNNLPSKLYPVVSLGYPGRFQIQPYQDYA
ncbi:hypothetical protein C1645_881535 [Glomus cerebriforme]|uniref:BTB domain-containing protein n=1 Tax=Glomus cerebriforme TaxID=658196 RepID=A0A397SA19_9GLOM|nr:hypothetical protein C1645_881535 [Glomus cerebriforme]